MIAKNITDNFLKKISVKFLKMNLKLECNNSAVTKQFSMAAEVG